MQYEKTVVLKNGKSCILRSGRGDDAKAVCDIFRKTHQETDFLLSYPEEGSMTEESERQFLEEKEQSDRAVEICAFLDGHLAGFAGIDAVGGKEKIRHRAEFGISVEKAYWGLGIGRELTLACIECAKKAGYSQVELDVVADNSRAVSLYESVGFREYGRNPRGFRSRVSGWQELVLMRLELD